MCVELVFLGCGFGLCFGDCLEFGGLWGFVVGVCSRVG